VQPQVQPLPRDIAPNEGRQALPPSDCMLERHASVRAYSSDVNSGMQTSPDKTEAQRAPAKLANAEPPDIASASVPGTLAVLRLSREAGVISAEIGTWLISLFL
jgi:hypothetical protein